MKSTYSFADELLVTYFDAETTLVFDFLLFLLVSDYLFYFQVTEYFDFLDDELQRHKSWTINLFVTNTL